MINARLDDAVDQTLAMSIGEAVDACNKLVKEAANIGLGRDAASERLNQVLTHVENGLEVVALPGLQQRKN